MVPFVFCSTLRYPRNTTNIAALGALQISEDKNFVLKHVLAKCVAANLEICRSNSNRPEVNQHMWQSE